jgi:hypothetical protein
VHALIFNRSPTLTAAQSLQMATSLMCEPGGMYMAGTIVPSLGSW